MTELATKELQSVFNYIFDRYYLSRFKEGNGEVELTISPDCNLGCKYCYLQNYKDELYPKELRNLDTIFNNIKSFIKWLITNNYKLKLLELFSGEIWHLSYGLKIMNYLYETLSKTLFTTKIVIPTNASFARDENLYNEYKNFIIKFNRIGVRLIFSFSVDGKIVDDISRPLNDKTSYSYDKFYDSLFKLKQDFPINIGFHPMISAISIKYWKENYLWWMSKYDAFGLNKKENLMMLEVRNDDWNIEALNYYEEFLIFVLMYRFHNIFNDDRDAFYKSLFHLDGDSCNVTSISEQVSGLPCSIQRKLYIRCGDLSITPCHRLSYNNLNYGKFLKNSNDDIKGIKFNNPDFMIKVLTCSPTLSIPGCDKCDYRFICAHGCLGSQYETMLDPFSPIPSVCAMQKLKTNIILNIAERTSCIGLFLEYLTSQSRDQFRDYILKVLNSEEYSAYAKK